MSQELSNEISPEIINSLILNGDMSKLTPAQQTQYYTAVCKSLELNPLTQPFAIIVLNQKKMLYATKACTQQLANLRKINTEIKSKEIIDGVYIVNVRATLPDGRFTDDVGAVNIGGLKGQDFANAILKSITKAKRRAVLALCGLGLNDETEIDEEQNAMMRIDPNKSRVEQIIDTQIESEVKDAPQQPPKEEPKKETKKKPKEDKLTNEQTTTTSKLPAGHGVVIGLIDNTLQEEDGSIKCVKISKEPVMNPNTGKADIKYSFLIVKDGEEKRYGTWDTQLAKQIMECVDNRIMVKFEYKERKNDKGIVFNDIVSFAQATMEDDT